ncbi:MAG: methylmalonyl-CoA epimerase [Elusimicrobia bacterium RIFCSPLOWO2_12_FULL_59_9]|nr:MAG: methylmalonyl-CoA epimerase [Elusimicrobia bacterium RIFCSPLOWO2_12_FULL_59_9]
MRRLDHVGIAVEKIEKALPFYQTVLGLSAGPVEEVAGEKVRVAFMDLEGARLELLEPAGAGGPISKFLDRRGPGLHHLAFAVQDVSGAAEKSRTAGFPCVAPGLRTGSRGRRVCFLDPRATHGVLIELVEAGAG